MVTMGLKVEDISAHKNAHDQRIGWRHETLWGLKFLWILVVNKQKDVEELLVPGIPEHDLRSWWLFHYLYV